MTATALPDDPNDLAALVADPSQPLEQRQKAFDMLTPVIRSIAARVYWTKLGPCIGTEKMNHFGMEEFVSNSISLIWSRLHQGKYQKQRGPFRGWCYSVLARYAVDLIRKKQADRLRFVGTMLPDDKDAPACGLEPQDLESWNQLDRLIQIEKFSDSDLRKIRSWHPLRDRLIVLIISGLWTKVPEDEWNEWVSRLSWPSPFPPPEMNHLDKTSERAALLADLLVMKKNTIAQTWCRKKIWLRQLDYLRDMFGDEFPFGG